MPSVFSPEDAIWIQDMLMKLRPTVRRKVALKYAEAFQIAFDAEMVSYKQDNCGRREANTRLRNFVDTYAEASDGICQPAQAFKGPQAKGLGQ
ncbi:hypothetical protein CRN84_17815 [Budvicia aquatica]|uniref:Uncharacterized protein n=1 Tax=Budvicia aquatica TaxID=82979 RepID=A0A2C6DNB7_9GAMM|nr:hypothetical protein CRN84_17815 [Budvicia aquatica]